MRHRRRRSGIFIVNFKHVSNYFCSASIVDSDHVIVCQGIASSSPMH